ncbi:MAG: cache domain-containing protein [Candidatus Heimdallarchaeota archaeon]
MGLREFLNRRSIRTNIMASFVLLSLVFMISIGGLSYWLMDRVGDQTIDESTEALRSQIIDNMNITATKNSEIINEKLSSAEAMVRLMSSEYEYLFKDENRYGPRDLYYDYWFEYNLSSVPADTIYDPAYGINLSWDYASYYFSGADDTNYLPQNSVENHSLTNVASMDYVFQNIHDNAPEFRWLYITFNFASDRDLFINYPGSIVGGSLAERIAEPYLPHTQDWYIDVLSGLGDITFTEPYFDEIDKVPLVTIGRSAYYTNGSLIGVICGDISIEDMVNKILDVSILDSGYAALITSSGTVIAHPEAIPDENTTDFANIADVEGLNSDLTEALTDDQIAEITSGETGILQYTRDGIERFLAYTPVGKGGYISIIVLPVEEALEGIDPVADRMAQAVSNNLTWLIIIASVSFAIGIVMGLILTAFITRPITHLTKVARSLSTERARKDIMEGLMIESVQQAEMEKDDD